jgi:NitT/TauT family transport system substrate-binding protein
MRVRARRANLAIAGLGVLLATACGSTPATPPVPATSAPLTTEVQPPSAPVHVNVGILQIAAEAGVFLALERGYFREEGVEVELTPVRGADRMPAFASGAIQVADGSPDPALFNAMERDIDLRLVASNSVVVPNEASAAVVVRRDLIDSGRYRSLNDLAGMTVGISSSGGGAGDVYLERSLAVAGLTLADISTTVVAMPDTVAALANKAVDAAWAIEPALTLSERQGVATRTVVLGDAYPGAISSVVMMSPQFTQDQPEAARRFVTAHLRGQRDYYRAFVKNEGGRDQIVPILIKHTALKDPDLYGIIGWHGVDPNGDLDERMLNDWQDHYIKWGSQRQRLDMSKVVDHSFIDYALARLGRIAP